HELRGAGCGAVRQAESHSVARGQGTERAVSNDTALALLPDDRGLGRRRARGRGRSSSEKAFALSCQDGSGSVNEKLAPPPSFGSAHSRPPWASMIERLIERPHPMPSGFVL